VTPAPATPAPETPAPTAAPKTIAYLNADAVVSRWVFDEKGFKDEAAALGDTAVVVEAGGNAQTQGNQVDTMITKGVDAMVITPVDVGTAPALYAKAQAANIPTVDYNFIVPDVPAAYVINRNAVEFGQIAAQQALKTHPSGNYIIVSGDQGTSVARDETKGYMLVLQPEIDAGKITIISQKWNAQWSPASAQAQVEAALVKAGNKVEAILSNNDGMAIGAMAALKAQGLLGKTFVSGVDCDLANVQAIAQGNQSVCIWTDFYLMGKYAAMAADAAARGTTPSVPGMTNAPNGSVSVPTITMPTVVVDQPGLCKWLKSSQWVPFDDAYKGVSPVPSC
jgi:D-xylose transport system substrate-binding protein